MQEIFISHSHHANTKLWTKFQSKRKVSQRSRILGSIQHHQEPEPLDGALTSITGCNFLVRGSFLMPCSSRTWMLQGQGTHHGLGKRIPLLPYHWHLTLYLPLALKSWLPGQAIRPQGKGKGGRAHSANVNSTLSLTLLLLDAPVQY